MTGTPDDVQRAATRTLALPSYKVSAAGHTQIEEFGRWIWNHLIELGWIPPNTPHEPPDQEYAAALQAAHDAGYQEAQQEAQFQIELVYLRGQRDANGPCTLTHATPGLDATTSPENWTPVPLRWRHVKAGDVFVADGRTWMVIAVSERPELGWLTSVASGADQFEAVEVDPDEVVSVLCPAPEANALARVRDELGGSVIDRNV